LNSTTEKTGSGIFSRAYFDGRVNIAIHPMHLQSDGKSIGHIIVNTNDPQKRSIDGSYPISVSIDRAAIITKQSHSDQSITGEKRPRGMSFMTSQNELRLNFIPEKNAYESNLWISTPWGDIREKIKYLTGFKHSLHETFECMIYAFIIAIVVKTFFFGAFFIPSQSMENTLFIGDRLVANRFIYFLRQPHRQEVVIFRTYSPKERMNRFHLEESPHFDPVKNLREADYYKSTEQLVAAVVDPSFRDRIEVKDGALYVDKLFMGFPQISKDKAQDISIDGKFFANGQLNSDSIVLDNQLLGSLSIDGNHLVLIAGDNRFELGKLDVYYPLGHSGLVQYRGQSPSNPVIDGIKSIFFMVIGRKPSIIADENQLIGNIVFKGSGWSIFNKKLDLNLDGRPIRFPLPYQGFNGEKVELGKLYVDNGEVVLKDSEKVLRIFGKPIIRDDVAFVNDQLFGYVERTSDGFLINGMPLTDLWEVRDFIKRCVALPGDVIEINDGKVIVNGNTLLEPYVDSENMRYDDYGPYTVPAGHYFMMGDNRNNSKDSRMIGPIPRQNIVGKAMFVFWPPNRIKSIPH